MFEMLYFYLADIYPWKWQFTCIKCIFCYFYLVFLILLVWSVHNLNSSCFHLAFSILSVLFSFFQIFIFMTVTQFGPLTCSIITTTRKFFTILGSVIIFGHPMSSRQWFGTMFVFAGLSLDSAYGKERKTVKS